MPWPIRLSKYFWLRPGGGMIPLGNGLLRVAPRLGVIPPSREVVIVVTELLRGELYGPRLKATVLGMYEIPKPPRTTQLSANVYAAPTRGENNAHFSRCQLPYG